MNAKANEITYLDGTPEAPFIRRIILKSDAGDKHWSPYDIEVMLHHHCSRAPFSRSGAPAYGDAIRKLKGLGLLEEGASSPQTTAAGAALVEMWCKTPIPVIRYVDPRLADK